MPLFGHEPWVRLLPVVDRVHAVAPSHDSVLGQISLDCLSKDMHEEMEHLDRSAVRRHCGRGSLYSLERQDACSFALIDGIPV